MDSKRDMRSSVWIDFGKSRIPLVVFYEDRSDIVISVAPDKTVTARAPQNSSPDAVQNHLRKRAPWILKQQDYFDQFHPIQPERRYVGGETHYYLGRQYRLRIRQAAADSKSKSDQCVKLKGRFFLMDLVDPSDTAKAKQFMQKWYSEHARILLMRRFEFSLQRFRRLGVEKPSIRFRRMKKRWGSCSSEGVILLNTELVKAPLHCIDYVIIHELCHLVHPYHDKAFYRLLQRMLPDWQDRKKSLETVVF